MHHPTDRIAHITAFVTPVVEHWLERELAQWVICNDITAKDNNGYEVVFVFLRNNGIAGGGGGRV